MPAKILELRRKVSGSFNNNDSLSYVRTNWAGIDGKPTVYPPAGHTHLISHVDGLQNELDSKLNAVAKGETQNRTLAYGGTFKVLQTLANGTVQERTLTLPSSDNTNNYLTSVTGSGNGTVTFNRQGLSAVTWNASHNHDDRYYTESETNSLLAGKLNTSGGTLTGDLTSNGSILMPFRGTAGTDRIYQEFQGVSANDATNQDSGAFIRFRTSTSAGYGADIGAYRRGGGTSALIIKTGGQNPTESVRIDENKNLIVQGNITSSGQAVVLNNDSRLTNSRPASDVQAWAKSSQSLNADMYLKVKQNTATWVNASGLVSDLNLATVALTGSYNDLTNKPTIPSNLGSLSDVSVSSPSSGQILTYSSLGVWEARNKPSYNASEIGGLGSNYRWLTDSYISTWNGKQDSITGAATTITSNNLTASRALISNGSGKVSVSAVTSTELSYLDGVTSNIQTQLNGKATWNLIYGGTSAALSKTETTAISVPSAAYAGKTVAIEIRYGSTSTTSYTNKIVFVTLGTNSSNSSSKTYPRFISFTEFDGQYLKNISVKCYVATGTTTSIRFGYLKTLIGAFSGTTIDWTTQDSDTINVYIGQIWVLE